VTTDRKGRLKVSLKTNPWYKRLRQWRPQGGQKVTQIEGGSGYYHQAQEVERCLQAGLLESPLMPWDETLQVLEVMDNFRQSWQLRYPQDDRRQDAPVL
jgi:hypothetical protein